MKIRDKIAKHLRENFFYKLVDKLMFEMFEIETETCFNIFAMRVITTRLDGEELTEEQSKYCRGVSDCMWHTIEEVEAYGN